MYRTLFTTSLMCGLATTSFAERRFVVDAPSGSSYEFARAIVADDAGVSATARAQSRTLYLNKNGVTISPGVNDARTNKSSIVPSQVSIPPWSVSSSTWAQTVACMRDMFAPFDVVITETDPGHVSHMEAVFGGTPAMLGFGAKMAGVSPFSASCKVIENSMVFTFTESIPQNAQVACEIMAQEIAHSYGLDHEMLAADPMSYLPHNGKRTFQNVLAECGENAARPCGISASNPCRERQNSYALLLERIGAAGTGDIDPPTVAIMSPSDGATVDIGFKIDADVKDDVAVKHASLAIDGVVVASLTTAPWTFTAPADLVRGKHVLEVTATDGAHEQVATIEITLRDANGNTGEENQLPFGCSTGGGTGWLGGLLLVGLVAIQRRAQR